MRAFAQNRVRLFSNVTDFKLSESMASKGTFWQDDTQAWQTSGLSQIDHMDDTVCINLHMSSFS
ncbi:hypothetical protein GCM10007901_21950 [Dyella acidisoli]|uniref:Uncharacterized protein n=1 Tax=Dyella acidisoli TaxID=1867834 RepID=A0ABQ5XS77_9GAMM|nr:hypothetical protein GCM10007901_21950 [Dyella acidisoli]